MRTGIVLKNNLSVIARRKAGVERGDSRANESAARIRFRGQRPEKNGNGFPLRRRTTPRLASGFKLGGGPEGGRRRREDLHYEDLRYLNSRG